MKRNKHIGSSLESLFEETGELEEVRLLARKKELVLELEAARVAANVSQSEMARRMKTSRTAVLRLLSPDRPEMTFDSLARAGGALGMDVEVRLVARKGTGHHIGQVIGKHYGGTGRKDGRITPTMASGKKERAKSLGSRLKKTSGTGGTSTKAARE